MMCIKRDSSPVIREREIHARASLSSDPPSFDSNLVGIRPLHSSRLEFFFRIPTSLISVEGFQPATVRFFDERSFRKDIPWILVGVKASWVHIGAYNKAILIFNMSVQ